MDTVDHTAPLPETKICLHCKENLPAEAYYIFMDHAYNKLRLTSYCRECTKVKERKAGRNPERKASARAYHAKHRERLNAAKRIYNFVNKARIAAKNKIRWAREDYKLRKRLYMASRDEIAKARKREYDKQYNLTHRAHLRVVAARWRRNNPEKAKAIRDRRRAVVLGACIRDLTEEQWEFIKTTYNYCCAYCGRKMQRLTIDHITPLSKGGAHTATNVVPACKSCNSKKCNRGPLIPVQPILGLQFSYGE